MGYQERSKLYQELETLRGKPLVCYVTSLCPNIQVLMASDALPNIIKQIQQIPDDVEEIDFLIISNGGDPITSLRIISILRERFKKISVIIPYVAYSAATILALGADEIIMHPFSNLGPVDAQLHIQRKAENGQQDHLQFSSEDIRNYIDFVKTDVGITDQANLISAFNALAKEVGPLPIGTSKRSQQLSISLTTKMLESHMKDGAKAATIAKTLNSSYFHHGYAVGRKEAKEMGLCVISPDKQMETVIWNIWRDFDDEMECSQEFNPINSIMSNPETKKLINNIPVIQIPANTPPEIAMNLLAQAAQQNLTVNTAPPIEVTHLIAAIESKTIAMYFSSTSSIAYWRDHQMNLAMNVTNYNTGWQVRS